MRRLEQEIPHITEGKKMKEQKCFSEGKEEGEQKELTR